MKLSLFALALLCAVALCSARGLNKDKDQTEESRWKSIDWSKLKDKKDGGDRMKEIAQKLKDFVGGLKDKADGGDHAGKPDNKDSDDDDDDEDEDDVDSLGGDDDDDDDDELAQTVRELKNKLEAGRKDGKEGARKDGKGKGRKDDDDDDHDDDHDDDDDDDDDKDDYDDKDLDDMFKMMKPKPVTPELLNNASSAIKEYMPLAWWFFNETEKGVAEFENSAKDASRNESLHGLYQLMGMLKATGDEAAKAYFDFYSVLYRLFTAGFSWEHYNRRLYNLTFVETARRFKEGLPMPDRAEYLAALRADLSGIRDEIGWAHAEVIGNIHPIDEANPPAPVYVIKEMAAIQYMTDKIGRDVMSVVEAVWAMIMHEEIEAHKEKAAAKKASFNDQKVMQEVRSLIETFNKLRSANAAGAKRALKQAQSKRSMTDDVAKQFEALNRKRRNIAKRALKK